MNAPPLEFATKETRFRLAAGELTCEMKVHLSTVEAARAVVESTLRAWEVDADLRWGRDELRFKFEGADIIDRSPVSPAGEINGTAFVVCGAAVVTATGSVSVHVTRGHYPDPPPSAFRLTPDAQSLLDRYNRYLDGGEPLLDMAYFCLTVLEVQADGRSHAAAEYRIDQKVLSTIGTLTSKHGDRFSARKASAKFLLTGSQCAWLEAAVRYLIWQVGTTPRAARSQVAMSSLPAI